MMNRHDKQEGILFGLAAGDRIGGPIRMAIQLSESLISQRAFDLNHIGATYLKWWNEEGFDTGPVAEQVFELVNTGLSFREAAGIVNQDADGMTAGCNPAHRSAVLAMACFISEDRLAYCAQREAAITHHHPLAGDVAAATVILCRSLIEGMEWEMAVQKASEGRLPDTWDALILTSAKPGGKGGYAPEVLKAAIYFIHNSSSFSEALNSAIRFAGPSNYCPVLVGIVGGARWGSASILERDLAHCDVLSAVSSISTSFKNIGKY